MFKLDNINVSINHEVVMHFSKVDIVQFTNIIVTDLMEISTRTNLATSKYEQFR